MFVNIRDTLINAAENVSQRFDQNRRRQQQGYRSASSTTQTRQRQPQEQFASTQPTPPASTKAIRQLPAIRVNPEDLVDPNNRECCICLDENRLDEKVTRLPCAHIFHTCCIVDWLSNHSCTCPICRYELPTDDPQYESGRIHRMRSRKPRFAKHELKRMPISDLLKLNRRLISGVLEREDLIKILVEDNVIDVIPCPDPVEYELDVLKEMKIGELKRTMAEAGVFFRREDILMKSDMISLFENSGRVILIRSESDNRTIAPANCDTIISEKIDNDQLNPPERSHNADIVLGSCINFEGNQILVETVNDDSMDLIREDAANDAMNEGVLGSTVEMFPDLNEELVEESRNNEEISDSTCVNLTMPNAQNPLPSQIHTANSIGDPISMISERLPQERISNEDNINGEEFSDLGGVQYDSSDGFNTRFDTQGLRQRDIYDHNLSATEDLFRTNMGMRGTFHHYTINELKSFGRDLQIDLSYCLERKEMIDMFVNAGITGNVDPSILSPLMFASWSVSQLRVVGSEIEIDMSECTSKDEMIESILRAGNVERPYLRNYLRSLSPLTTKSLSDLRAIARELRINISDCLEKDEIIKRLIVRDARVEFN